MGLRQFYKYIFLFLLSVFILTGCGNSKKDTPSSTSTPTVSSTPTPTTSSTSTPTASSTSTPTTSSTSTPTTSSTSTPTANSTPTTTPFSNSGGGSATPTPTSTKTKGYLIDSPISGVSYFCDGAKGLTDSNGKFECLNPPVTFKIGKLTLGTLTRFTSDSRVYPHDILGLPRTNFTDSRLIFLTRLLQSIDDDGNISVNINITSDVADLFTTEQNLSDLNTMETISLLNRINKNFLDEDDAIEHLKNNMGILAPIDFLDLSTNSIIIGILTPLEFKITNTIGIEAIELYLNDENRTANIVVNGDKIIYTPTVANPLPLGQVEIKIKVKHNSGNESQKSLIVFVKEEKKLSATPIASQTTAYAPTTIRFAPKVSTDNAIQTYYWDFDGDGTYDRSDIMAYSYTWNYTTPGDYNATLKVVDVNGKKFKGSTIIHILNAPPQVTVESSPSNGATPLDVNFIVTATDSNGIALYEWDFDGDGVYEANSTSSGTTTHQYTTQGVFNARLRVTDSLGASTIYTTPTTKVLALATGSPSVTASASASTGQAPLSINFSATATDPQGKGFAQYEWDFDGDGIYDYNGSTASVNHTFVESKIFYPKIKVTTTDGRVTYDSLEINVKQSVSLSVSTDTIDIENNDTVNILTSLGGKAEIKLVIENDEYMPVKTIQDWTIRDSGNYSDSWNALEGNSSIKEGKYYAVLLYKENGEIKRLDLRDTTGGARYNPARNNAPRSFAPLDNRPLKMTFTLPRASEVISFMGYSYSNTRIITFRSRESLGKGTYTDIWNGQNDEGVLIEAPSGKYFMYGVWAYTLADNAIYVKSGAYVSNLIATPPIYSPDSHEAEGKQSTLKVSFELNKASDIELELYDAKRGVLVASRQYIGLSSGEQTIKYDGKDNHGDYLYPGTYTLGIRAIDENGFRSIMQYTIIRIYY